MLIWQQSVGHECDRVNEWRHLQFSHKVSMKEQKVLLVTKEKPVPFLRKCCSFSFSWTGHVDGRFFLEGSFSFSLLLRANSYPRVLLFLLLCRLPDLPSTIVIVVEWVWLKRWRSTSMSMNMTMTTSMRSTSSNSLCRGLMARRTSWMSKCCTHVCSPQTSSSSWTWHSLQRPFSSRETTDICSTDESSSLLHFFTSFFLSFFLSFCFLCINWVPL